MLVSFASSIGATLAFLASRFLLRDSVQRASATGCKAVNEGMARDGAFYLFTLRLVPVFPFFIVNLVMGLTPIRARTFYWVSQLGMLAGTIVYVNAGTQLAQIDSLSGILSPGLLRLLRAARHFPAAGQEDASPWLQGAPRLCEVAEARALRPQPGRDRRRRRRAGDRLHRRGREGQGDAGRSATRWAATA